MMRRDKGLTRRQKIHMNQMLTFFLEKIESKHLLPTQIHTYTYIISILRQLIHETGHQHHTSTQSTLLRIESVLKYFQTHELPENDFSQIYREIEKYFSEFAHHLRTNTRKAPDTANITSVEFQRHMRNITR